MNRLRAALLLAALGAPLGAHADIVADAPKVDAPKVDAPKADAPKADKEGFVPVAPNEALSAGETLPASNLVGAAYGFILAAMVAWIASVAIRARRVEDELVELRKKIDAKG